MDILLVEDDPVMRDLLKSVLAERGHRVSDFCDGESAWQACQTQHFPLLLVDWMLPGMDGLELCRKVRSSQPEADNLILVITARTEAGDLEQVLAAGADDYLAKPVDLQLLNVRLTIAEKRVRQLQQQIVSTNELLLQKDIIENGVEGIVLIKASDATIHYCNRRFEILFGYEPGELIGKHISIINAAHEKSPQETADEINRHLEQNGMWSGEVFNCRKDGKTLWTHIGVSTFQHPELGALWITYQKNISERKQMEQQLLAAEADLNSTLNAIPDLMFELGLDGGYYSIRAPRPDLLAAPVEQLLGKNIKDFLPPEAVAVCMAALQEAQFNRFSTGRQFELALGQEGKWFELSVALKHGIYEGGPRFIVLSRDITDRKLAVTALLDKESQYRVAIETSVDGFWVVDMSGRVLEVNNAYVTMSGYSRDELLNMFIPDLEAQERPEETAAHIEKILRNGQDQFETMHKRKDGSEWPVHITVSYSPLAGGRIFVFVTDLSDRQRKDLMLQQQSRLANMGEMVGNIAHQWRQPINALGMILYDLEDAIAHGQFDQDYLHRSVEKSNAIIQRMSGTIDDFRNFFRIDNNVVIFDLHQSVQECLNIMEAALNQQQIAVTIKHANKVMVSGRTGDFSQGMLNLLANAKDVIVERKVENGQIEIEITENEECCIVSISDNGGGIDSGIISKIFDPYFTTKADGIGIGLYMTRMAIEKNMRGHIDVDNFGEGARFTIKLPKSDSGECTCQK